MSEQHTHEELHQLGIAHSHGHGHTHTHENTKAVLNRMARIIGHMESIRRMVEDGRDCSEVLVQIATASSTRWRRATNRRWRISAPPWINS